MSLSLTREECRELHVRNAGQLVWLDFLAVNDGRLVLKNEVGPLHHFMSSEWDEQEQAQAARLCAAINNARDKFKP